MKPVNICAFLFITTNIFQYGYGLYYSHQMDNKGDKECIVSKLNSKEKKSLCIFLLIE